MSESEPTDTARTDVNCSCTHDTSSEDTLSPHCVCPREEHGLVVHTESCLLFKHETLVFPRDPEVCECKEPPSESGVCECCQCPVDQCRCNAPGKEFFDQWRENRVQATMPAVLESTHPLMQKFQESLRRFLEKENELAESQIKGLQDELKSAKTDYENTLEGIYRSDHDTNAQRVLIEEYEQTLIEKAKEREEAEKRMHISNQRYKEAKEKLDQDMLLERDSTQEMEALQALVQQLEKWREETESDLTISQRMTDKMKQEKQAIAQEKRDLDMIIYGMNNEIWKLESKLELFKKQMEIKSLEMAKVNDKVTAYATELEDLELDKKRLVSLWNSVLVNIKQRDNVYGTIRQDYRDLQENYRTLCYNLEVEKKAAVEEMQKSKEIEMTRDKINYQISSITKTFDAEDTKRETLEHKIDELKESIYLNERDQEMIKMENQTMRNILSTTEKEYEHRIEQKRKLENEILENLQDCLLNDKAVESMAQGIKKMRDMSRKLEISLMKMENQHAKVMMDIEIHRNRQVHNAQEMEKCLEKVRNREKELDALQEKYDQKSLFMMKKQRELDSMIKKYTQLKELFDGKSPQEVRIYALEQQIKALRERTETLQHEWLRLQGHVVKLTAQYQKCVADISLINKQIQICDQKTMSTNAELEGVRQERVKVERALRDLRGRLQVLERNRKEANERNLNAHRYNLAITHEFSANLKDAESQLIQIEDDIERLEKEKMNLTQDLDRVQKEALIWQRKGILAVELKRNIKNAQSASGEIGQMKNEIHRMEVRREQLRRTAEKLSEDLAQYVMRRDNAVEKSRATAAVENARGASTKTSQSQYHHKLRLARADVARVTKDLQDAKAQLEQLQKDYERLEQETADAASLNNQLEEHIASLMQECRQADIQKQWLLERVVRNQRLGSELGIAVKRQTVKIKKPKNTILQEYTEGKSLNENLRYIVETLDADYPHLHDKFEAISNTLNIFSPDTSPRLLEDAPCEPGAEDPGCTFPTCETPQKPYCACPGPDEHVII